jgi:uncharacterized protein (UPF0264 family)
MARLLVSVRNAAEARAALVGNADLIDVKEPSRGSLGPANAQICWEIVRAVGGQAPVSAALGELSLGISSLHAGLAAHLRYVKMGLAGCGRLADWPSRWREAWERNAANRPAVAVAYADYGIAQAPPPEEVLQYGSKLGCRALLVDTYDKRGGPLFEWLSDVELTRLCDAARSCGLMIVLAGSLTLGSVPHALSFAPDYVAVRGAACCGGRGGVVDSVRVQELAYAVKQHAAQKA